MWSRAWSVVRLLQLDRGIGRMGLVSRSGRPGMRWLYRLVRRWSALNVCA